MSKFKLHEQQSKNHDSITNPSYFIVAIYQAFQFYYSHDYNGSSIFNLPLLTLPSPIFSSCSWFEQHSRLFIVVFHPNGTLLYFHIIWLLLLFAQSLHFVDLKADILWNGIKRSEIKFRTLREYLFDHVLFFGFIFPCCLVDMPGVLMPHKNSKLSLSIALFNLWSQLACFYQESYY